MAEVKTLRIRPPVAGADTQSSPNYVASDHAVLLENFIPTLPGRIAQRGRTLTLGTVGAGAYWALGGYLEHSAGVAIQLTTTAGAPIWSLVNGTTWAEANTMQVGQSRAVIGSYGYGVNRLGIAVGGSDLLRWDGTSAAGAIVLLTNGPHAPTCVCTHLNRLWVGGGEPAPGGGTYSKVALYWSDAGGSPTNVLAEWQDDVSGLVNQIILENDYDAIVNLARVGRYMAIIRERSLWLLTGDTSTTFAARRVITGVGGLENTPILETTEGVVFFSGDGIYLFDGSSASLLNPAWRDYYQQGNNSGLGGYSLRVASLGADWIMVANSPSSSYPFCRVLHLPTRAWFDYKVSTSLQANGRPTLIGNYGNYAFGWDIATKTVYLQRNDPSIPTLTGPQTVGHEGRDGFATPKTTAARYWSKVYELASPMYKAQLKRVMVEYAYNVPSGTPSPGLQVSLYNGAGTQLLAASTISPQVGGTTVRQQVGFDCFAETSDVQVRVEYSDSGDLQVTDLEIFDCWLEYQVTRQK